MQKYFINILPNDTLFSQNPTTLSFEVFDSFITSFDFILLSVRERSTYSPANNYVGNADVNYFNSKVV